MTHPDPTTQRIWARADRYTAGGNSCKYIVVHNTANTASAVNEARNLANNAGQSSFHYAVDDADIVQCVHDYDTAWAVGAWSGARQLIGNNQSISIEVCNPGTQFSSASIENLRKLVLHLMEYYGIPASNVVRHWDCHTGRKRCPAYYAGDGNPEWAALHKLITTKEATMPTGQVAGDTVNDSGFHYRAHVADLGWLDSVRDGQTAGTTGQALRLEALKITPPDGVELTVLAHVSNKGWVSYEGIRRGESSGEGSSENDPIIGTVGQALQMEALQVIPTEMPKGWQLRYRVHVEDYGWTGWVYAPFATGSVGMGKAIEAVQFVLEK